MKCLERGKGFVFGKRFEKKRDSMVCILKDKKRTFKLRKVFYKRPKILRRCLGQREKRVFEVEKVIPFIRGVCGARKFARRAPKPEWDSRDRNYFPLSSKRFAGGRSNKRQRGQICNFKPEFVPVANTPGKISRTQFYGLGEWVITEKEKGSYDEKFFGMSKAPSRKQQSRLTIMFQDAFTTKQMKLKGKAEEKLQLVCGRRMMRGVHVEANVNIDTLLDNMAEPGECFNFLMIPSRKLCSAHEVKEGDIVRIYPSNHFVQNLYVLPNCYFFDTANVSVDLGKERVEGKRNIEKVQQLLQLDEEGHLLVRCNKIGLRKLKSLLESTETNKKVIAIMNAEVRCFEAPLVKTVEDFSRKSGKNPFLHILSHALAILYPSNQDVIMKYIPPLKEADNLQDFLIRNIVGRFLVAKDDNSFPPTFPTIKHHEVLEDEVKFFKSFKNKVEMKTLFRMRMTQNKCKWTPGNSTITFRHWMESKLGLVKFTTVYKRNTRANLKPTPKKSNAEHLKNRFKTVGELFGEKAGSELLPDDTSVEEENVSGQIVQGPPTEKEYWKAIFEKFRQSGGIIIPKPLDPLPLFRLSQLPEEVINPRYRTHIFRRKKENKKLYNFYKDVFATFGVDRLPPNRLETSTEPFQFDVDETFFKKDLPSVEQIWDPKNIVKVYCTSLLPPFLLGLNHDFSQAEKILTYYLNDVFQQFRDLRHILDAKKRSVAKLTCFTKVQGFPNSSSEVERSNAYKLYRSNLEPDQYTFSLKPFSPACTSKDSLISLYEANEAEENQSDQELNLDDSTSFENIDEDEAEVVRGAEVDQELLYELGLIREREPVLRPEEAQQQLDTNAEQLYKLGLISERELVSRLKEARQQVDVNAEQPSVPLEQLPSNKENQPALSAEEMNEPSTLSQSLHPSIRFESEPLDGTTDAEVMTVALQKLMGGQTATLAELERAEEAVLLAQAVYTVTYENLMEQEDYE